MREQHAKVILQSYLDKKDTSFEDDNGDVISGWKYIIGERVSGIDTEEGSMPLDQGSFGFIVYLVPPEMTIKEICKMDEYGVIWCVSPEGDVYMPES